MLEGIRVVEIGTAITGPLAGMMLADLGADVVKIEPPGGDAFRHGHGGSYAPTFVAYNRNKKSVVLDLTKESGREAVARLLERSDVLVNNYRPGVMSRLGLDAEQVREINPSLIHCSITGFGNAGPYHQRPAFDLVGQALSGLASLFLDPGKPEVVGPTLSDNITAMQACSAILAALVERQQTGRGRQVEVNMLEATMAFISDRFTHADRLGKPLGRHTRAQSSQCFAFRCGDSKLVAIHLSTVPKFWFALLAALELGHLAEDPRFLDHQGRTRNYAQLNAILAERFRERTQRDWIDTLVEHDVPAAPVLSIEEVAENEQVMALGSIAELHHPVEGKSRHVECPVRVDGQRPRVRALPAPSLGEHTLSVLDELGLAGSDNMRPDDGLDPPPAVSRKA